MPRAASMGKLKRIGYLARAAALAAVLGVIEIVSNPRGRRVLGGLTLAVAAGVFVMARPIRSVQPGEAARRVNKLTGGVTILGEGWAWVVPLVSAMRAHSL